MAFDGNRESRLRVGAYTGGKHVPSARFRVRQYVEALPQFGIELREHASLVGRYPPEANCLRPAWLMAACAERSLQAPRSYHYDAVIFQRELVSTLLTLEPLFARPRILDVDDAIWLHPRGTFAGKLAARCDAVICGNVYLAEYFDQYCKRIFLLPTAVNTKRFFPLDELAGPSQIIGWSGTDSNLIELERVEPALRVVMSRFPGARLRVICNRRPALKSLPADRIEYVPWTPEVEVTALQDLRVGLMPLGDSAWTRGKCAFKMLTYMACAVPVVASPVGMNADVLAMGNIGFGARTQDEWVEALTALLGEPEAARAIGREGRSVVASNFSVQTLSEKMSGIIRTVVG